MLIFIRLRDSNQRVFWASCKARPRHLLEMVMSRRKAPEPWPQPLARGLSARRVRQNLRRVPSPWLPGDKMPTTPWAHSLGYIICDVCDQTAPISSLLLPRWFGGHRKTEGSAAWVAFLEYKPFLCSAGEGRSRPAGNCFHPQHRDTAPSRSWEFPSRPKGLRCAEKGNWM